MTFTILIDKQNGMPISSLSEAYIAFKELDESVPALQVVSRKVHKVDQAGTVGFKVTCVFTDGLS